MTKNDNKKQGFETRALHAGTQTCPHTGATSPAIHQSTSYLFRDTKHAANIFSLKEQGFLYSRVTNPTVDALEKRIAALEGGTGATCTASGLSANLLLFSSLLDSGDEFVSSCKIYGGTTSEFRDTFKRAFGWTCHFVDPTDPENFRRAITEKTKVLFAESMSNPEGVIVDIEALAMIAEEAGVPLVIDNTIPTPYLCRPFEYGAAVVVHSTTKYLSGHGHAMGGAVVDGGQFDWKRHGSRFATLTEPNESYHGLVFADNFAEAPLAAYSHGVGLRDLGMNQQPMNAYLTMVGMDTLALRMERHSRNALEVALFLEKHDRVSWVNYAGLESSPYHDMAQRYMHNGMASSLFTFGLKNGYDAAIGVVENVKLFSHLANIGDARSLIIHPASTTHSELTEEQKIKAGALPEAIRISVGLETADDLIADLEQALSKTTAMAA